MKLLTLILALTLHAASLASAQDVAENLAAKQIVEKSGYRGTVLIFDQALNAFSASHPKLTDERFIPASTFKVMSSLCALDSKTVMDQHSILKWDAITRNRTVLNQDLDLSTAFRVSAVPHYQQIVRKMGDAKMQQYLDNIPYGNKNLNGGIDQFWLTGSLRISPREQIEFLKRLYHDDLPFSPKTMATVREMMKSQDPTTPSLFSKTGWAILEKSRNIGWWVGWIETHAGPVFFATVLDTKKPRDDFGNARLDLTTAVLQLNATSNDHK